MSDAQTSQPPISEETTFFQALFDFKFTEWVTLRVAGVLYLITIILLSLFALIGIIAFIASGPEAALVLVYIVATAAMWFLLVLLVRLGIEASIATIAVAQNTASLRK
jgi:hypothetical protein